MRCYCTFCRLQAALRFVFDFTPNSFNKFLPRGLNGQWAKYHSKLYDDTPNCLKKKIVSFAYFKRHVLSGEPRQLAVVYCAKNAIEFFCRNVQYLLYAYCWTIIGTLVLLVHCTLNRHVGRRMIIYNTLKDYAAS